ncbi:helix-turn-helix domain-containing protein [Paenibacillus timonensis]|uniref:Helix-turn-helix domain-containing protein n=1 Tax=Paenibacillus timonensis TaxID=225915 RepID=A0ABW3SGD5_9BACL|nr:helix-turn-helix transcriptional regulator [Paenibacillus timonensis]MCH1641800.1 helix-turn-helix domain-containing protein [Paenibacillus timonensis]
MEMLTREKYVERKCEEWAAIGGSFKTVREAYGLSALKVAIGVGVSESTLRRFEKGMPVLAAKTLEQAYKMFLQLHKVLSLGFHSHLYSPEIESLGARLIIDWELGGTGAVTVYRLDNTEVAKFDTGDFETNCALATDLCERLKQPYYFTY